MNIAFQGEPGAYSEEAIYQHYPNQPVNAKPCTGFPQVFNAVANGSCDAGFVPIENSLAGSIYQVYDLLTNHKLWIIGEHYLRVEHCLIAMPGTRIEDIRKVISHPHALAQCGEFLSRLPGVVTEQVYDTAGGVKILSKQTEPELAVIASCRAAQLYGMEILATNIEDDTANFTRFFIISRDKGKPRNPAKTSIVFTMKNEPGSLFKAMSVFALRGLDLTKIDSRPLIGKPWDYFFYLDFKGSTEDSIVKRALRNLDEFTHILRVFGSYPDQRA